ncbi:hypothetical protein A9995_14425 [Erythrobacter sp. QSSC1-22B]|nr:hypothetical protein A9995_14425 [Erythrobacter sp. QSSC1-22B]
MLTQLANRLARPVEPGVRDRARLHLLDWLACIAGALRTEAGALGRAISPTAWEKSTYLGNALEMDDVHRTALLHPGPVVWPTALSYPSASLAERLNAGIRGYEAMIAIGGMLDAHHYAHWHPTGTMGGFGAAAAFGSLIGFGPVQYANALANAGSVAGGVWHMRHDDVLTKQWHVYHAVRTGRDAVLHVHYGATGPAALLEGPQGVFAAMARQPGPMPHGKGWLIREVSLKPYAACRHTHPAIDAAMELRAVGRLQAPFEVQTYADALAFCDRPDPVTELDAKFSLQHAVAIVSAGRHAEPSDFSLGAIAELGSLRSQVTVCEDPAITARYPAHFGATVNGFELVDARGDPERPMSREDVITKLRSLCTWGGLSPEEPDRAIACVLEGDDAEAIDRMLQDWLT